MYGVTPSKTNIMRKVITAAAMKPAMMAVVYLDTMRPRSEHAPRASSLR